MHNSLSQLSWIGTLDMHFSSVFPFFFAVKSKKEKNVEDSNAVLVTHSTQVDSTEFMSLLYGRFLKYLKKTKTKKQNKKQNRNPFPKFQMSIIRYWFHWVKPQRLYFHPTSSDNNIIHASFHKILWFVASSTHSLPTNMMLQADKWRETFFFYYIKTDLIVKQQLLCLIN